VALQVVTLRLAVTQVLLIGALRGLQLGDPRDRDVPPARAGRVGAVEVGLDVDHRGTVGGLGLAVGLLELRDGVDLEDVQAPGSGVGGDVDAVDDLLVGQVAALAAAAVLGAEALGAAGLRKSPDGAEAVVLKPDVDALDVLALILHFD